MNMYIPVLIVAGSDVLYHICCKSIPAEISTFASLSVTYLVGAVVSFLIFFFTKSDASALTDFRHLNWSSFALGLSIIGLEAGYILMYKVGWSVSAGQIVQSAFLAIVLIFVGRLLYNEPINAIKLTGIVVCLIGLYLINR